MNKSKNLIVIGDTHFSIKEPFYSAGVDFVNWFLENKNLNNENNILLHLGDLYTDSCPNPKVHELGIHFLKECNCSKKYLLVGNHDKNRAQNTISISPLSKINGVEIIERKKYFSDFHGLKNVLFFPFVYDKSEEAEGLTQRELYEQKNDNAEDINYIFHHIEDENISFGGNIGIDLTQYKNAKKIGGHIHIRRKGYLGTPFITRFDERKKDSHILSINLENEEINYINVPKFLDYEEIKYDEEINGLKERFLEKNFILDIVDAPSRDLAEEKFKDFYTRNITLKKEDKLKEEMKSDERVFNSDKSVADHFEDMCKIKGIKNKKIKEIVLSKLR